MFYDMEDRTMFKYITVTGIFIIVFAMVPVTLAEKATELYIPIGQSPGLSGKYLATGRIEQVNYQNHTLTISSGSNSYPVKVTERTMIFLDRSKLGQSNRYGSFADCKKGMTMEVRFEKDERGRPAEWIKLEMHQ
jgi:hypothetical protein